MSDNSNTGYLYAVQSVKLSVVYSEFNTVYCVNVMCIFPCDDANDGSLFELNYM